MTDLDKYIPHAHFSVAAGTVLLVVVGVWGVCETKKALELTQRAWVSPLGAQLSVRLEANKGIHFAISVINSGREPAIDITSRLQSHVIDRYDSRVTDMINIVVPPNTSCDNIEPVTGRSIIPPTPQGAANQWFLDSQHGEPSLLADDSIARGDKFYVAEGCFAYRTYQTKHIISYCYIMEFDEIKINIGSNIAALPPNIVLPALFVPPTDGTIEAVSAHVFTFAPCSIGFEAN
jgi:hypothetical protein